MARTPAQGVSETAVQNATHTYAVDAEASDAYAITLDPAPTAYADGQRFTFKANTANTGASSLNVNGLGAKTLKKEHDVDTATGDIEAGSIVEEPQKQNTGGGSSSSISSRPGYTQIPDPD